MTEREFLELRRKKDQAQRRAHLLSECQLGSSALGVLCWIVGFFLFNRQPIWFFFCLVFTVISFVLGCVVVHFRNTIKKIETKMKSLMGGSGAGRTRYSVTPTILKETEE